MYLGKVSSPRRQKQSATWLSLAAGPSPRVVKQAGWQAARSGTSVLLMGAAAGGGGLQSELSISFLLGAFLFCSCYDGSVSSPSCQVPRGRAGGSFKKTQRRGTF